MITGYNTDVEYAGVTYHVQTEDKGLQTPVILSLVYEGGAILASKRSAYDDLVAGGFDEELLATRLKRQHKLICAAVHAGRIEDLKRMTERDASPTSAQAPAVAPDATQARPSDPQLDKAETVRFSTSGSADDQGLTVRLIDEPELRGGQSVTLRLFVSRANAAAREPAANVPIVVKTLGTAFSPQATRATTDGRGVSAVSLSLPDFKAGRAAILIQAEVNGETAELRRIILPAKS